LVSGILIVGVGPGLGRSVAMRFAREGMPVGLIARRDETLAAVAADLRPLGVPVTTQRADAGDQAGLQAAIAAVIGERGVPDVAVYNAGLIQADAPGDLTPDQQTQAWSINVLGALTTATATMPAMAERGRGTFLVTGGMPVPVAAYLSLSLGKAGVRALTAMLAEHYGPRGVHAATVTVAGGIAPGGAFDPDVIAEQYWRLHTQPRDEWETEVLFTGAPVAGSS
jgi:NAD(P)-dependent dehydrogenase (short-subunit alcohol dehydrogenase family)